VTILVVPELDEEPWPTLGPAICDLIEERAVFGPGSLKGQPAKLDTEKRAAIWRMYEVYPKGHPFAGRRRFSRVGVSWRKGTAKTEWAAWIAFCELHPDGPVRFDGWDAYGNPVGRPVNDPFIPMVAYTEEQVEELAYGALYTVVTEGPDADLFDSGLDRIIRLDERGRADGRAVPLAGSPNANDGARTTFQHFDETHRMTLPRLVAAHETMLGNIPKRPLDNPWSLETTTAGEPGAGSVAEKTHREAEAIAAGKIEEPDLYYMHREASQGHNLSTLEGRIAAITEATGPAGEYGPGQFRDIAKQWDRPGSDKNYLERVWLNRWVRAGSQAFDVPKFVTLGPKQGVEVRSDRTIKPGARITAGFDGARTRDATAIVLTEVESGLQNLWDLWERPEDAEEDWEIEEAAVTASVEEMMSRYKVVKMYCDPPHWTETVGSWESRWPDRVEEWWTNRPRPMAEAIRAYVEAIDAGQVTHDGDPELLRHIANAGRKDTKMLDDAGVPLFILNKQRLDRKFDAAMAAVLSWKARLDVYKGAAAPEEFVPRRIR
jgi:hypothetical protein